MLSAVGTFAGIGFYTFSRGIERPEIPASALAEGADLNLSAFSWGRMLTAVGTFAGIGFYASAAASKAEDSGPSPGRECGPEPVRFLGTASAMMASGAPAAERTSVVSSSAKRHGLCQ
jgi:hypothetical protein